MLLYIFIFHFYEVRPRSTKLEWASWPRESTLEMRSKRGMRGGLHARLKACIRWPPLTSPLLANMRSLENKLDKLRARITTQREKRECCTLIFTETWLSDKSQTTLFSYRLTLYTEETILQPPLRPKQEVCLSATRGVEMWRLCISTVCQMWSFYS